MTDTGIWFVRSHMVLYQPVISVRQFCGGVYDQVTYYFQQSSATYYLSSDDGETVMIEIQEPPQLHIQVPADYGNELQEDESQDTGKSHTHTILLRIKLLPNFI